MDMQTQLQQIFAKTWSDEAFKAELQQNPAQTLREMGIDVPEGKTITVLVDDEHKQHLVIPQQPDDLSDEDMDVAAGGGVSGCLLVSTLLLTPKVGRFPGLHHLLARFAGGALIGIAP